MMDAPVLTDTRSVTTSRRSQQDAADRHYGGESGHLQAKQRDAEPPGALALLTAWDTLDLDGSGRLSAVEAAGLKTVLNIDWNIEQAWEEATRLEGGKWTAPETDHEQLQPTAIGHPDPRQHSVEISFGSFAQVYNTRMGARRRQRRLEVKAVFDKLDKDHIGALNKQQIDVLVRRCSKQLALLPPAFELDRDWSWLTSESKPTDPSDPTAVDVPWLHFERWWKNRCGLTEASSPIIPEYFARCSATLADAKPGGQDGDGRATKSKRWRYLVPRLQLLGQMSSNWALNVEKPDGIAISTESVYESNPIPPGIRDPDSIFSAVWDVVQVMFLLYVSITVPYRACFEIEVTLFSLTWFWDTMIDLYFLTDMLLNFRTAYTDADGIRQVDPRKIAANYFKGWFVLDFISCIPVSHISMMSAQTSQATHGMSEEATSDNMRALKAIRLLRMSKMLRLARIKRILQKYESLMAVQEYISVGFAIASIVFLAHFLSCLWYLVGLTNQTVLAGRAIELGRPGVWQDPRATTVLSWVNEQPWFEQNSTKLKAMVGTRYIASMYFVFNALDGYGQTDNERMVGVVALVFTIVIKGFIAGIMSSMLISLGGKDQEMNDALRRINSWVSESRVPGSLTKQCLDYFRHHLKNRARTSDAEALSYMPPSMRVQFREHIYGEHLNRIPIFRGLSGEIMAAIRAEMTPMVAIKGQIIYEEGSVGSELYIVMNGEVEVKRLGQRLGFLSDGAFFGEPPMLGDKLIGERTRTVEAITDVHLCFITAVRRPDWGTNEAQAQQIGERYPELKSKLRRLARAGTRPTKGRVKGRKAEQARRIKQRLVDDNWTNAGVFEDRAQAIERAVIQHSSASIARANKSFGAQLDALASVLRHKKEPSTAG